MSASTNTSPEPENVCKRCDRPVYKDGRDWRTVDGQKLVCKGGGPHTAKFPPVKIDWTNWREVLDEWEKEV